MKRRLHLAGACFVVLAILAPTATAAPYPASLSLDPQFTSASVGADGSILVNLEEEEANSSLRDSTRERYLADGRRDRSFRPRGAGESEAIEAVDSKGRTLRPAARGGIERIDPDGTVEAAFVPPARDSPGWEPAGGFPIEAILPLPSGRVAVAGRVVREEAEQGRYEVLVAVYDESGRLDPDFGTEGIVELGTDTGVEGEQVVGLTPGPGEDLLVSVDDMAGFRGEAPSVARSGSRVAALDPKGALDPSFGTGGAFSTPDRIAAVAGGPGGGLLLAGTQWGAPLVARGRSLAGDIYLERLTPSGTPDPAFGERDGRTIVDLGGIDAAHALLLRPDGSALVGGGTIDPSPRCLIYEGSFCSETPALVAVTASGRLERAFGREGVLRLRSVAFASAHLYGAVPPEPLGVLFLRELPGGSVLAGGGNEVAAFLAEVDGGGRLQPGFGVGGIVTRTNPSPSRIELTSMTMDRTGRIVASGTTDSGVDRHQPTGAVFRFREDGAVDRGSSDGDGFVRVPEPPSSSGAAVALDARDRTLALGGDPPFEPASVTRIGAGGWPDPTFGIDGIAALPRFATVELGARRVRLNLAPKLIAGLPQGGCLVYAGAGYDHGEHLYPAVIRLTSNGRLNRSFGHRGVSVIVGLGRRYEGNAMTTTSAGGILLAGRLRPGYSTGKAVVIGMRPEGGLDRSFGRGGAATTAPGSGGAAFDSLTLDPEGVIFAVGGTWTKWTKEGSGIISGDVLPVIARFAPDGRPDLRFAQRVIESSPLAESGRPAPVRQVIFWRGQILTVGQGMPGVSVYSQSGRFERTLVPEGTHDPAGDALGIAVEDGRPVIATTTSGGRPLTVRPLLPTAG
jgi:uncharacterized delta-60 repeat protein